MEYGVEKQVSRHSVLGATVVVGVPLGVTLRVRLTRGQQTYTFPLHLSDEVGKRPAGLPNWHTAIEARKKKVFDVKKMLLVSTFALVAIFYDFFFF